MKTTALLILLSMFVAAPAPAQQDTSSDAEFEALFGDDADLDDIDISGDEIVGDEPAPAEAASADDGEAVAGDAPPDTLDGDIEALKKEVLSLNRDLFILEEDLLFPANTQFSVFLSMDAGALFQLDSVQLRIDDKTIANHLYTERELAALRRGGVQRLYIGNLASGEHEIIAFFVGVGPSGRDYRRGETLVVEKTEEPQFIEFTVTDDTAKEQPRFDVRVWE